MTEAAKSSSDSGTPSEKDSETGSSPGTSQGAAGRGGGGGGGRSGSGRAGSGGNGGGGRGNGGGRAQTGTGKAGSAGLPATKKGARQALRASGKVGGQGGGQGGGKVGKKGKGGRAAQVPAVIEVQPVAEKARMKKRHWGLLASFLLMVFLPFAGVAAYMWGLAEDQYSSIAGFTVRQEESGGSTDMLSPILSISGSSTATDGDILYEFIQSQEMVQAINARIDLRAEYSQVWPEDWPGNWQGEAGWPWSWDWAGLTEGDWVFGIWPDATLEDLVSYWGRIVGVSYDGSTGLIEVQVKAFDPDTAQAIGQGIVAESQEMINELSAQAREDATRYAEAELDEAVARLKIAREAMTRFRTRTRIVDPAADLQGRMGVMNNLQQKLADALVEYDLLRGSVPENDPRITKAQSLIDVIRERIASERQTFASDGTETGDVGEDYPSLIAEFESLTVDREFAEEAYRAALAALDAAKADAARQSRYLATYIPPSLPETAEYPRRWLITGIAGLILVLLWSITALIFYSIRDRG
ncbi:sugar transporter [Chachezhania antarctica]|uniref:sugar transporter n=1 Tax=Chachezhania antarctica TaxID=2340860 RepID=UPI0023E41B5D|nr:sugar transporter [Chachezhania antarctica]